ncbi:MAG TPA: VOC family protein [Gemmatimonadaceae bacterium]|nr:VOC family protein [Gemmatimonadaceae bacterium]
MPTKSTPAGYHSVTPSLIVRGAAEAIEFYQRAFDAKEVSRFTGPDGKVMHAEIQVGDSRIMLGDENPAWGTLSPLSTNGNPSSLHVYVENADASYERALRAGAKVRYPIEDAFWGDRYGKVTDPFGHDWGIATRVKDLTPEEMQRAGEESMAKMMQKSQAQLPQNQETATV